MPGSLAIPNVFVGQSPSAISKLDADFTAIASYVNTRELVTGLLANRPAAGTAGAWYFATDSGTLYTDNGSTWITVAQTGIGLAETLSGLTLSNDAVTPNTVLDIAAGAASSDDATISNRILMTLAAFTKTTAAWAVGSGDGGLDTGAIGAASWYHVFVIQRPDTGVVDVLFSLSATTPTMPTNYTKKRRIGSFKTASSNVVPFTQYGDEFLHNVPLIEVANAVPAVDAATLTLAGVPTGIIVDALLHIELSPANTTQNGILLSALEIDDTAPSLTTTAPLATIIAGSTTAIGVFRGGCPARIRTNTLAQIRDRAVAASGNWSLVARGWIDRRGRG